MVISKNALSLRLKTAWDNISTVARGKARKADKEKWESKLDKLLDVTVCQCKITVCTVPRPLCPAKLSTAWQEGVHRAHRVHLCQGPEATTAGTQVAVLSAGQGW